MVRERAKTKGVLAKGFLGVVRAGRMIAARAGGNGKEAHEGRYEVLVAHDDDLRDCSK